MWYRNAVVLILVVSIMPDYILAQDYSPWIPIDPNGEDFPHNTGSQKKIDYSENLDLIIWNGCFIRPDGTRYLAGFDGDQWITIHDSVNSGFFTSVDYQDGLLIGGSSAQIGPGTMPYMAFYDGNTWSHPWAFNGHIQKLKWTNDTLFALGSFTEIDGNPAYYIAKLVGNTWEGVITQEQVGTQALFRDIQFYQGKYYVGGNFNNDPFPHDFAIVENGQLVQVGAGLVGANTEVMSLEVFQNELYLSGLIPQIQGNVGNHILRWNGTEYNTVGDQPFLNINGELGVSGGPAHLVVHEDYLYGGGSFAFIGDLPIHILARWDGQQWCGLHTSGFNSSIRSFDIMGDQLVAEVLFQQIGDTGYNNRLWLYEDIYDVDICTEPLNTSNLDVGELRIYPNPGMGNSLSISAGSEIESVRIIDSRGVLLFAQKWNSNEQNITLDVSVLKPAAGVYIVEVQTRDGRGAQKWMVVD